AAAMKSYWKVSMQALIMRAYHLGKMNANRYRSLFRQLSAKGYRKCEPAPIPAEEPEVFRELLEFHRKSIGWTEENLTNTLGELQSTFRAYYGRNFSQFRLVS